MLSSFRIILIEPYIWIEDYRVKTSANTRKRMGHQQRNPDVQSGFKGRLKTNPPRLAIEGLACSADFVSSSHVQTTTKTSLF